VRRRRRALLAIVLGTFAGIAGAFYVLRPSDTPMAPLLSSQSAVDQAAAAAAASAKDGAAAADAVEQRGWSIGQFATQVPAREGVSAGAPTAGLVALTFDDGPGPNTYDVLALLRKYKMHATFFIIGMKVAATPGAMAQAVAEGNVVGNHTWTHASLPSLKPAILKQELRDTTEVIRNETGHNVTLQRPPFGDFTAATNRVDHSLGMLPVLWNVDSADWSAKDSQTVVSNVLNSPALGPGAIILLHDGGGDRSITVNALPAILDGLVARGLRSVTIPELLRAGPPKTTKEGDYKLSEYAVPSK